MLTNVLASRTAAVESAMRRALDRLSAGAPSKLVEAISYSLFAGGKRIRPALILEWARAVSGSNEDSDAALAAASAMEFIHTFSLIHDDLPAMDDDDLRRGRPTNHVVFGDALAILAGDALTTLAFEILTTDMLAEIPAEMSVKLVRELSRASGPMGMIGGQVIDIQAEQKSISLDELRTLHAMKTGALLSSACRMGAIVGGGGASHIEDATQYGRHLGLAFQIVDDLLDATGEAAKLGKAAGKDAARGKNTYPTLLGVEESRSLARSEVDRAIEAIAPLRDRGAVLVELARFVLSRDR